MNKKIAKQLFDFLVFLKNTPATAIANAESTKTIDAFKESDLVKSLDPQIDVDAFVDSLQEQADCHGMMSYVSNRYAKKRRGKNVKESFDELHQKFREAAALFIEEGQAEKLEAYLNRPFMKELFDQHTQYKYKIHKDRVIHESVSLENFKKQGIDSLVYEFEIQMKESEVSFANFIFFKRWFKPRFAEGKQMDEFIVSTDNGLNIYIDTNILESFEKATGYFRKADLMSRIKEGIEMVPAGTQVLNETTMPGWIKNIINGKCYIREESPTERILELVSGQNKFQFQMTRDNITDDFWGIIKKS